MGVQGGRKRGKEKEGLDAGLCACVQSLTSETYGGYVDVNALSFFVFLKINEHLMDEGTETRSPDVHVARGRSSSTEQGLPVRGKTMRETEVLETGLSRPGTPLKFTHLLKKKKKVERAF